MSLAWYGYVETENGNVRERLRGVKNIRLFTSFLTIFAGHSEFRSVIYSTESTRNKCNLIMWKLFDRFLIRSLL